MSTILKSLEFRIAVLSSFSMLFFSLLLRDGFDIGAGEWQSQDHMIFSIIGLLSILHSWILTLRYRRLELQSRTHRLGSISTKGVTQSTKVQIIVDSLIAVCGAVLLNVLLDKDSKQTYLPLLVTVSYFLGVGLMHLVFYVLRKSAEKRKSTQALASNFSVLITTYVVLSAVLYNKISIGEILLEWYPFGNLFLNLLRLIV